MTFLGGLVALALTLSKSIKSLFFSTRDCKTFISNKRLQDTYFLTRDHKTFIFSKSFLVHQISILLKLIK